MGRLRNNRDLIPGLVSTIALAIVVVIAFLHIKNLGDDIEGYNEQLEDMIEKRDESDERNKELAGDLVRLQEEIKELAGKAEAFEDITAELENKADGLENEKNELTAVLDELERQNGELLKKFDGLSKPN